MSEQSVPVLIVGGGGAGLTASMLLAGMGVEHLLVSSLPGTSVLPKAHVLNQRAMEILEDAGVAATIAERSTPAAQMAATAFYAGFAGGEGYGRRIAKLECWGAGGEDENWRAASAWRQLNLPQIRLEPLLKAHAEELSPGRVRFNHELTGIEQDGEGVTAEILDKHSGSSYTVRSSYVIAADGGRTVPGRLGVDYEGLGVVGQTATIHATVDLSPWATDPDVLLRWIWSPQAGTMLVLAPMGPTRWGPDSEEWVIHLNYQLGDPRALSDEQVLADVRDALGLPELEMQVHGVSRWQVDAVIASAFSVGRVFLLGDAAHRHPPTGGLGLTSAIHDAQNICWKLAHVLDGHAGPELLDSYEPERRSAVARNAQRSLENVVNHLLIGQELEFDPAGEERENWARLERAWSERPEDAEKRRSIRRLIRAASMEFGEHNVEYGYTYESGALVADGSPEPVPVEEIRVYEPSTRPGAPLPHAWIDDEQGNRRPIKDLVRPGRFLLIAGEAGESWCEAARALADGSGIPLDAVRIGHLDGELFDPRCTWLRRREFGPAGAILVRPDRFVAWRSMAGAEDPAAVLAEALGQVLARPLGVAAG
jgi:2,4-dichlorophenol 6-monooxygenase